MQEGNPKAHRLNIQRRVDYLHWISWKFSAHPRSVQNWVCRDPEERAWVVCGQKPERMLARLRIPCWLGCAWERTKWYVCTDEELCGQVQQFVRNLWVYFAVYGQYLTKVWRLRRRGSQEKLNTNQRWVQDSTWTCKKEKGNYSRHACYQLARWLWQIPQCD